jgi:hypothetical protein
LDYQHFRHLLAGGETVSCILMKECGAFSGSLKYDAELARDIIALANNETALNYIIIGVSKNGEYQSADNDNLTDENLQVLCKKAIFPLPVVKLEHCRWNDAADDNHKNTTFIVIRVEAEARRCFRFKQEFNNPQAECNFKEGEVWVRHGTKTEFASPEEIKKLFEKKIIDKIHPKLNYANLPYAVALPYVLDELERLAGQAGGKICSDVDPFIVRGGPALAHHLVIPVNGKPLLLRIVPAEKCVERGQFNTYNNIYLTFEHGILLISLGNVAETAADLSRSKSKEEWGWFCTHPFRHPGLKERKLNIPLSDEIKPSVGDPSALCFVFENIGTSEALGKCWTKFLASVKNQNELIQIIETNRNLINAATASFIEEGCPLPTNKTFRPKNLLGNEMWAPKKYGSLLLNRQPEICNALQGLLDKMKL